MTNLLFATVGLLDRRGEELVTEEVDGTNKDDTGVVTGLKSCNQQRVGADGQWEIINGHVRLIAGTEMFNIEINTF